MGDRWVCNGEYKCELSGANKRLVPDHIDRRVESGSSSTTGYSIELIEIQICCPVANFDNSISIVIPNQDKKLKYS